jgi:hypothetical protein
MKKIYSFLFVALMMSQNVFAQTCTTVATATENMTWTGAVNNDWANSCNWSPNGVPTATNPVFIENVANDPVVLNGTTANCQGMTLHGLAILTINNGGVMNVTGTAITVSINASVVNNGTLSVSSTSFFNIELNGDNASVTNSGTLTLTSSTVGISFRRNNNVVTNTSTGIINLQSTGVGFRLDVGTTGQTVTNQGTINYSGASYALILEIGQIFNNSGTFNITNGAGIAVQGGTLNNLACGKILMSAGSIDNSATSSLTTNAGLIVANGIANANGTFNNTGVINRLPANGAVTHTGNSAVLVQSNTTPIFNYGGAFAGTINGIFTNATATTSAGTFAAPNTFTPSNTIPAGSQTLYAKITPVGGACEYIVPFKQNINRNPTQAVLQSVSTVNVGGTTSASATTNTVEFAWTAATDIDGDALTYKWQLSDKADFSNLLFDISANSNTNIKLTFAQLNDKLKAAFGKSWNDLTLYHRVLANDSKNPEVVSASVSTKFVHGLIVANEGEALPTETGLIGNYPNPFNPSTEIQYQLSSAADVRLSVYDMQGREVKVLVQQAQAAGKYHASFDATGLSSGAYFYRLEAGKVSQTQKMLLVK